ncbi:hypothetical protein [Rhizobium sp. BK176]|uniref:hypothetical protein n=1 Tax=Rhizobium sp. BK176 TaxID=2587071 RepID=UPI002167D442|nr:hypothetical protein [Rhizobium sp. BK176]MCS4088797.1 hypothetical protein [Rhizobium sp. BK176]
MFQHAISSSRACAMLCASLVAGLFAIKFSPIIGVATFALIIIAYVSRVLFHRAGNFSLHAFGNLRARGRTWGGRDDWFEVLTACSILYILGAGVWLTHLIIEKWDGKEIAVAVLVGLVSITVPACGMRHLSAQSEKQDSFGQACGVILLGGMIFFGWGWLSM